jgi:hypothetical protein
VKTAKNDASKPKRRLASQRRVKVDLHFVPERLPQPGQRPVDEDGHPCGPIEINQAEMYVTPTLEDDRWGISLDVFPAGEGRFMGIEISVSQARKLRNALDIALEMQEEGEASRRAAARAGRRK